MCSCQKAKHIAVQAFTLPLLDHARLSSPAELKTALVYLTCITYGYVWCDGEEGIPEVLPACLAVPYAAVAERLQVPPSISQYSFILLNWKLKDPQGKVELDNMESIVTLRGGKDESWFYCTTVQVELDFAPALSSIIEAQKVMAFIKLKGNSALIADYSRRKQKNQRSRLVYPPDEI
eukprot:XP_011662694.1 PREDICTED: indoleamine 2,3-dioxygenase 2-like [Strongylocentrotus purpuratus]